MKNDYIFFEGAPIFVEGGWGHLCHGTMAQRPVQVCTFVLISSNYSPAIP